MHKNDVVKFIGIFKVWGSFHLGQYLPIQPHNIIPYPLLPVVPNWPWLFWGWLQALSVWANLWNRQQRVKWIEIWKQWKEIRRWAWQQKKPAIKCWDVSAKNWRSWCCSHRNMIICKFQKQGRSDSIWSLQIFLPIPSDPFSFSSDPFSSLQLIFLIPLIPSEKKSDPH